MALAGPGHHSPVRDDRRMSQALFTYSCLESEESADAWLWHRTGQMVEILREVTYPEVDEDSIGGPMYEIRFKDGRVGHAWNDEIEKSCST